MTTIWEALKESLSLLLKLDHEAYSIIGLSLWLSLMSTGISALIGVPLGILSGLKTFRLKKLYSRILYTFMSLPPVVIGLVVSILLSRSGPLGSMGLLFTPSAMVIAQILLITPIIMGITFNNTLTHGKAIYQIGVTLGGSRWDILMLLIKEMKINFLIAIVSGFGRAISEVGAVMIVGGNIKGHTRVMTTFIAMNSSMGNYSMAIAMGIVLLILSFLVNSFIYRFITGEVDGN